MGQTCFHKHKAAAAAAKWLGAAAAAQQSCSALSKEGGELYEYNYFMYSFA